MTFPQLLLVRFEPSGKTVAVSVGSSLLEAALRAGIQLPATCGGQSECGECRLALLDGKVSPTTRDEIEHLSEDDRRRGIRLACCARVLSAARVHIFNQK